ncbi:MAG: hypothetical protein ACI9WS_002835, partial [Paraglaciecola psychrophila]
AAILPDVNCVTTTRQSQLNTHFQTRHNTMSVSTLAIRHVYCLFILRTCRRH